MKLELKHLAQYLPYELRYANTKNDKIYTMKSVSNGINMVDFGWGDAMEFELVKPILRPLSDLTERIDKDEDVTFLDWIISEYEIDVIAFIEVNGIERLPYEIMEYLFEWHFDISNLIENNLAIDINTIK